MPPEQAREFNRYVGLMNGVNAFLTFYTGILDQSLAAHGALVAQDWRELTGVD
jgi:hypothetical protein